MADRIADLWESVKGLLVSQYAESPNLQKLIESCVNAFQQPEEVFSRLSDAFDLERATGGWLDLIGRIRNVRRASGESDDDFRARLSASFGIDTAGTPDNVTTSASRLSGDPSPAYIDECPATFFVYTPGGVQLSRGTVRSLAPAGVLGLPGARIETAGGLPIATADGTIVLAAARDEEKGDAS